MQDDYTDILARTTTLITVLAAGFIQDAYLSGEELWVAIVLNFSAIFTFAVLIIQIGPKRLYNSFVHFVHQVKRNHKMHTGQVNTLVVEELVDMSVAEFAGEPDEVKMMLTKKFPSQPSILTYWKKQYGR